RYGQPRWSPDGNWLMFTTSGSNWDIVRVNVQDNRVEPLTTSPGFDWGARWSPDGQSIAFISNQEDNAEIYVMRVDGSDTQRLTFEMGDDSVYDWSPDGKWLLYTHQSPSLSRRGMDIYRIQPDGTNRQRLTFADGIDSSPTWLPIIDRVWSREGLGMTSLAILLRTTLHHRIRRSITGSAV
ncbi:MAG: DUF5050 domain-containing protein, partial [Anaerolineae bacterium]